MANESLSRPQGDVLKIGDANSGVLALQRELNNAGYGPLLLDGKFGKATEYSVMAAQRGLKIQTTGVAGKKLSQVLGLEEKPEARARRAVLSVWARFRDDIIDVCLDTGLPPAVALALLALESAMHGLWKQDLPVLRFDVHKFRGEVPSYVFNECFRFSETDPSQGHQVRDSQSNVWHTVHVGNQALEYFAVATASVHNLHAAYESCLMGAAMLPGSEYKSLGYETALDMFVGFASESEQAVKLLLYANAEVRDYLMDSDWERYSKWRHATRSAAYDKYLGFLLSAAQDAVLDADEK